MKIITEPKIIDEILNRGTIVEIIPSKKEFRKLLLSGKRLRFYIGFDPTAPTLHLSHAKNLILMEKFRRLGHKVIILFGDFTARIGDPTGRVSARQQLSAKEVQENVKKWKKIIKPIINLDDKDNPAEIVYNSKWLAKLNLEKILNLAAHFTVQQMIVRDMFQKRLTEKRPIFLHEFLYPLMQGYDSMVLEVDAEVCGQDQIFNALVGRTLLKKFKNKEKFVVAVTLMENPKTGELMSKSKGVGVFLDVGAEDLYGQIMAQPDEMIEILFINNTYLPLKEIKKIMAREKPRDAKMRLAFEITKIFHGERAARLAEKNFVRTFQEKKLPEKIPEVKIKEKSINLIDLLLQVGLIKSKSEGRRLIKERGIKVNGQIIIEEKRLTIPQEGIILQRGKKKFLKVLSK